MAVSDVRDVSGLDEVAVRRARAVEEFNALKVQVLIDDDELPEVYDKFVDLERLADVLGGAPVPSRVYVDGRVYKIKLRRRMKREEYRELMKKLEDLGDAWWDKRERVIKLMRYEDVPAPAGEVQEDYEVIAIGGARV